MLSAEEPIFVGVARENTLGYSCWSITHGLDNIAHGFFVDHEKAVSTALYTLAIEVDHDFTRTVYVSRQKNLIERVREAGFINVEETSELNKKRPEVLYAASRFLSSLLTNHANLIDKKIKKDARKAVVAPFISKGDTDKSSDSPRVLVATDASLIRYENRYVGGIGVVYEDGKTQCKTMNDISSCGALEMWAIYFALIQSNVKQKALIQTDSTEVISKLSDREKILKEPHLYNKDMIHALRAVDAELAQRDIIIAWVKGHSGMQLNELADNLAKLGRSAHNYASEELRWKAVDQIILDSIGFDSNTNRFINSSLKPTITKNCEYEYRNSLEEMIRS